MNSVTDSETKTKEVSDFLQWVSAQNGDLADAEFCDHLANVVTYGRERANEIRRERAEEVIDILKDNPPSISD